MSFSNPLSQSQATQVLTGSPLNLTKVAATSVDNTLPLQPTAGAVAAATDLNKGTPSIMNYFKKTKKHSIKRLNEK